MNRYQEKKGKNGLWWEGYPWNLNERPYLWLSGRKKRREKISFLANGLHEIDFKWNQFQGVDTNSQGLATLG